MSILLSHPNGNANVKAVVNSLNEKKKLHSFHISVASIYRNIFYRLSQFNLFRDFQRREYDKSLNQKTFLYPRVELFRILFEKINSKILNKYIRAYFSFDKVCSHLDMNVAKFISNHSDFDGVYCYEDSALQTFKSAKLKNKICIYDLPIGYWRAMHKYFEDEKKNNPNWSNILGGVDDNKEKLEQKDLELKNADLIFVASTFTKKTLEQYPQNLAKICVIPYGFPEANVSRKYNPINGRKLKVLFVGGLSQRKGISYVFQSLEGVENIVELTVVGRGNILSNNHLKENLEKCNYIPSLPHEEILNLMSQNDVLLFPSLFEGFGLVITEAMSQGTIVITTDRTCGPDFIQNGINGFIVPCADASAIKDIYIKLINNDSLLKNIGMEALRTAQSRSWSVYGTELCNAIDNNISLDGRNN